MGELGGGAVRARHGVDRVIDRWEEFLRGLPHAGDPG